MTSESTSQFTFSDDPRYPDSAGGAGRGEPLKFAFDPAWRDNPVLDRFWLAVRRLPKYARLAAHLMRDPSVPLSAKSVLAFAAVYTISPVDLIPGFIPVAGQLDNMVVLLLGIRTAVRACPPATAQRHLLRVGISGDDFDGDLRATRAAAQWLAEKGLIGARSLVGRGTSRVRSLLRRR